MEALNNCRNNLLFKLLIQTHYIGTDILIRDLLFTLVVPFNDASNKPQIFREMFFIPLCNRNSIILCMYKGAVYHRMLYLRKEMITWMNRNRFVRMHSLCVTIDCKHFAKQTLVYVIVSLLYCNNILLNCVWYNMIIFLHDSEYIVIVI